MHLTKVYSVSEKDLVKKCIDGERRAQEFFYHKYKSLLFPICLRYLSETSYAEDALQKSFVKIFSSLKSYRFEGSFEGWLKRITVNECLMYLRKIGRIKEQYYEDEIRKEIPAMADQTLLEDDILKLVQQLPEGYRQIFNLYVIDGYKHREIADILNISIHTSKSQLRMARKRLQEMLKDLNYPHINNFLK